MKSGIRLYLIDWGLLIPQLIFIILVASLSSCHGKTEEVKSKPDSLALRIAILPIGECQKIMDDSTVVAIPYLSLMDIDTAAVYNRADVYLMDSVRIKESTFIPDSVKRNLVKIKDIPVEVSLVANRQKRIHKTVSLKEHMVGCPRWCELEYYLEEVIDSTAQKNPGAKLKQTDVYRAQINSLETRTTMLQQGMIDVALLPHPYSDSLMTKGHTLLCKRRIKALGLYADRKTLLNEEKKSRIEKLLTKKIV